MLVDCCLCVGLVDYRRLQLVCLLHLLSVEYALCNSHHLHALCRIAVGCHENASVDEVCASPLVWQGIDTVVFDVFHALAHCHPPCSHGEAVVVSEDAVDVSFMLCENLFHGFLSAFLRPVSESGRYERYVWKCLQCVGESPVAFYGGRRAFQSGYLDDSSPPVEVLCDECAHGVSHLVVVGADVCGIFL